MDRSSRDRARRIRLVLLVSLLSGTMALNALPLSPGTSSERLPTLPSPGGDPAVFAAPAPSAPLAIQSVTVSPSATAVVSQALTINVTVTGGAPPYSYWYTGLPYRCFSSNTSSLVCAPSQVGVFPVKVTVNDSALASVNTTTTLNITSGYGGPPKIDSFQVDPSPVKVGQVAEIYVNATSESSTPTVNLGYAYFDLPPGCSSFNQTPLQCIPSKAGTYTVLIRVTDGFGDFSQASETMNVTGGPSSTTAAIPLGPALTYGMVALVVLLVLAAVYVVVRNRRKKRGPPTAYVPPN